ncbi:MAG: hypothetical protein AAGG72_09595, partial [Pseudomonadota bacterium]
MPYTDGVLAVRKGPVVGSPLQQRPATLMRSVLVLSSLLFWWPMTHTVQADPTPTPGMDPGGVAVAFIGGGITYTQNDIALQLARDGEGVPIGWDFIDGDFLPFAAEDDPSSDNAAIRLFMTADIASRIISVRASTADALSIAKATAFATQTPARIVAILSELNAQTAQYVSQIAAKSPNVLFVTGPNGNSYGNSQSTPENMLRVAGSATAEKAHTDIQLTDGKWRIADETAPKQDAEEVANLPDVISLAAALTVCVSTTVDESAGLSSASALKQAILANVASGNTQPNAGGS